MAIVGLAYLAIAPFPEAHVNGTMPVYENGIVAAKLVSANLTYERSEVTLEEDNVTTESDISITGGSLSLSSGHFTDAARQMAFGMIAGEDEDGVPVLDTTAALPPYVGAGFILSEQVNGVESHVANLVFKTQFALQGITAQTKGKQKSFQTQTANGTFMGVQINQNNPTFVREARFDTLGKAQAWINKLLGVKTTAA
ncbi:MAG: hypothetical protein IJ381_02885 [Clostridia bacterium]|nr:hypothetical protein [Clostridia bacterium]